MGRCSLVTPWSPFNRLPGCARSTRTEDLQGDLGSRGYVDCPTTSHPVSSPTRRERATSVLLADPCFQLRSICYLLGQPEPPTPGTALPAPDRKRFSLQSCEWARGEENLGDFKSKDPQAGFLKKAPGFQATCDPSPSTLHPTPDTDYINVEELVQVEQMLTHLTSASAQAAAASLVRETAVHGHPRP